MDHTELQTLPFVINLAMSIIFYFLTVQLIPSLRENFIKHNLWGFDMNKKTRTKM